MAGNRQAAAGKATMSDAAIQAKTGRDWAEWFAALDNAGAAKRDHAAIAELAAGKLGAGPWYGQMVAVSYERARGIRAVNQKCDGEFSVSVTKVLDVPLPRLFAAATQGGWFPKGVFEETSRTKDKYWRGKWNGAGRLAIGFIAKGSKAQIAIDSGKLSGADVIEKERAAWKKALVKLEAML
jgi:hypothetical protein